MSANVGGYIRGPWWRYILKDDEKTRRCYVVAWGNIVIEPLERYQETSVTRFTIKTGRGAGRNERYLHCVSYGDRMANIVAKACERGDVVFLCGTWVETQKTPKKGKNKGKTIPVYECHVNILVPMGLIGFLLDLYATPEALQMVNRHKDAVPDVWESDDDDYGF